MLLDENLTDGQRLAISSIRQLMERYGDDYWFKLEKERNYPEQFVTEFEKAGFAAAPIPEEYGGPGLGIKDASLILEEINALGGNCQPFHGQYYLLSMLSRFASAELKQEYLPRIAKGELRLQTFALTEPEAGTETMRIRTFAEKHNHGYRITGHKIFISRFEQSDLMVLAARTTPYENVQKKTEGISLFLVPLAEVKGIQHNKIEVMFNTQTYELFLEDLELPERYLIGEEGLGFKYLLNILNPERILLASECIGDARWFIDKAVSYAKSRVVYGRPIGSNQGVQFPLAEAYANLIAARGVRSTAADLFDSNADVKTVGAQANISKYLATECSWQAANAAMDVYGGYGMATDSHIERKFRENRLYRVAPIPQNLVLAYIAQNVLELPRSY